MEEVDLNVRLRKVPPKEPVVLDVQELLALIDKLTNPYQLAAKLQCGAGLRRQELVTLRIKDIDLKNGLLVNSPRLGADAVQATRPRDDYLTRRCLRPGGM